MCTGSPASAIRRKCWCRSEIMQIRQTRKLAPGIVDTQNRRLLLNTQTLTTRTHN